MTRRAWRIIGVVVVLGALAVVGAVALAYSGVLYVGADRPAPAMVEWLLETTSDRSVARHARGVQVPSLAEGARVERGAREYDEMCAVCHGAPGVTPGGLSEGLSPAAPDLAESAGEMSPAEIFWITQHGIRMTGMPAWGKTHTDDRLWDVVAFVERLPGMTPAQYQELTRARAGSPESPSAEPPEHRH